MEAGAVCSLPFNAGRRLRRTYYRTACWDVHILTAGKVIPVRGCKILRKDKEGEICLFGGIRHMAGWHMQGRDHLKNHLYTEKK
ncbi:hypothetical protein [Eisenbergiella sp.]